MKENYNDLMSHHSRTGLATGGPLFNIDLPLCVEKMKEEKSWKDGMCNALTVYKSNEFRLVLISLHKGSEMTRHVTDGTIGIQVLQGSIQFNTDQHTLELGEGQMMVLHPRIFHSVRAIQTTIFLLTILKPS